MSLDSIVNTELLFDLELRHPETDAPLGVVFKLRSANSREAKAIQRRQADANMSRMQKRKSVSSAVVEQQMLERAASYIVAWDWGTEDWRGEKPELTPAKALEVVSGADWIYSQVTEAAEDIANFSSASVTTSPKPSE